MDDPAQSEFRFVRRETLLLVLLAVVAAAGFGFTREVARAERARNRADAAVWFAIGKRQLSVGQPDRAVASLRKAASLERDNRQYALALAQGLSANQQLLEARAVLLALRDRTPDDPDVSVELARLAAVRHMRGEAVRFYQNALYGVWPPGREPERQRIRIELVRFLLSQGERSRALSELVALGTNIPDTASARLEAGRLFLDAGDPTRALEQFRGTLRLAPDDRDALVGAGEASFARGDYAAAGRDLSRAGPLPAHLTELREVARLVIAHDPLEPRLTLSARRERLRAALWHAGGRLDACLAVREDAAPALDPLRAEVAALLPQVEVRILRDQPELAGHGVDLVLRAEQAAASACGPPSGLDHALLLIGDRHRGEA